MRKLLIVLGLFAALSCNKKEKLDPTDIKKVILLQVDYQTYQFDGGKEFSYFLNDTSTVKLPVNVNFVNPVPNGRLTVKYGSSNDTLFDGTVIDPTGGKRQFPQNIDNQIHYYKLDFALTKPADSRFQTIYCDLATPIDYSAIWGAISKLQIVESYQQNNPTANIGIFLYRPSSGVADPGPGDWKWYVVLKG